jgi:hypothetical protein
MLAAVDESLESYLRAAVPLSAVDIDVSFEPPDEEWAAKLTRPTVNLHLWDVKRSSTRAITGVEHVEHNGTQHRRLALPRVELRYFITVWTTAHDDERSLLGSMLVALLARPEIPAEYLARTMVGLPNPELLIARAGDSETFSLEQTKLGLQLMLLTVVDTGPGAPVAPAVEQIDFNLRDTVSGAQDPPRRRIAGEVADPDAVGATVRSPLAVTTVNPGGRFLINARPGDEIVVETDPPRSVVAPPVGGVVVGA